MATRDEIEEILVKEMVAIPAKLYSAIKGG